MTTDTLRKGDLQTIVDMLKSQRTRSIDLVAPASAIECRDGHLLLSTTPQLNPDGVTDTRGTYWPNTVGDEGLAEKLRIPLRYLRELHADDRPLFDANINGRLRTVAAGKLMLRLLRHDTCTHCLGTGEVPPERDPGNADERWITCPECKGIDGVVRAVLSDKFNAIDNLDVLLAGLDGLRQAGVTNPQIEADLTERRMYVRITTPEIAARADALVKDYRDPRTGRSGRDYPLMWGGLVFSNSETGDGRFAITPRVVLQVCTNGQTITRDVVARTHVGARLDEGVIEWSAETLRRNLALIKSQTADAVRKFLSVEYVATQVSALTVQAGVAVTDPVEVVKQVSKRLGFDDETAADILTAFIKGGDATSGGVMHAVTAVAQTRTDGDVAAGMEDKALDALAIAAGTAR